MRRTGVCILILCIVYSFQFTAAFAASIPSIDLINDAKDYDAKSVVYTGEVIGDVMKRGNFSWANVNDGINAIGIWAENSLVNDIAYTGSYKERGDSIEVTGIFHRSCPEHGGDLDIHAVSVRKIKSGAPRAEQLDPSKKHQAAVLMGALCIIWILSLFKRK